MKYAATPVYVLRPLQRMVEIQPCAEAFRGVRAIQPQTLISDELGQETGAPPAAEEAEEAGG